MNDEVWVSNAPENSELTPNVHLVCDVIEDDKERALDAMTRSKIGEPLEASRFALKYFSTYPTRTAKPLLPLTVLGFFIVNEQAATVLLDMNLGDGGLYPLEIYQYDRTTRVEGEYYNLNIGNQKRAVSLPNSNARENRYGPGIWHLPYGLTDDDIAVTRDALDGPDIWVDPTLQNSFFVSGRLADSLRMAGIFDAFCLHRCRVV